MSQIQLIVMWNIWFFSCRIRELTGTAFIIPLHTIICLFVLGFIAVIGEVSSGRLTGSVLAEAFKKALEYVAKA